MSKYKNLKKIYPDLKALQKLILSETITNLRLFKDYIDRDTYGEYNQYCIDTIISSSYGWRISSRFLELLKIKHNEDEAIELVDSYISDINNELDVLLKSLYTTKKAISLFEGIADIEKYNIINYFGWFESDSSFCLLQTIQPKT